MRTRSKFFWPASVILTVLLTVSMAGVAFADDVINTVDNSPDVTLENLSVPVGGDTATSFFVQGAGSDGEGGCNIDAGETFTLNVLSSDVTKATVSPSPILITDCGQLNAASVTVHGVAAGTSNITVTINTNTTGAGTYELANASFTAVVDNAPAVSSTSPADGAAGVAVGTNIDVNFSENVTNDAGTFSLECPTGTPVAFAVSGSGSSTLTLDPSSNLPGGTTCTVTVLKQKIHDTDTLDGFDEMAADYMFSFTTAGSNTAPSITWTANPSSADEGQTKTYNFSITDPDANTWSFATDYPDCGSQGTLGTSSINQVAKTGTFQCTFPDGYSGNTSDVKVKVNDGAADSNELTQTVAIANLPPVVAGPTWSDNTIDCGDSATLTGISFNDPGNNDNPWALGINWGGSETPDYSDAAVATEGSYANQSHTYNTPGTYTATVTVTDKDGAADNGQGSNTSDLLTVAQTYTVSFLQPLDGSDPSKLIANSMKKGRVVPVKATILDDCTGEYVTNITGENVTINVVAATFTVNATDAVESFSDAGSSSAGTTGFRWTADSSVAGGGFWIYNLDSTGFNIGTCYKVKVVVDGTAVNTTYAILKPTK